MNILDWESLHSTSSSSKEVPLEPLEPSRINWPVVYGLVGFYFILIVGLAGLMQKLGQ